MFNLGDCSDNIVWVILNELMGKFVYGLFEYVLMLGWDEFYEW